MYLLAQSFPDSECHAAVGAPICFGTTLTPATPAVVDRFSRLISAKAIDAAAATAHLVDSLRLQAKEQIAARLVLEKHLADSRKMLEEAQRLAALPITGDEIRTIKELLAQVDAMLELPLPTATRVDRLRRYLPMSLGLDLTTIGKALEEFDTEAASLRRLRDDLMRIRDGLTEAARTATDPATLTGVAKLKANVKLTRALTPERVADLEQLAGCIRSNLSTLESEIAVLRKAVA